MGKPKRTPEEELRRLQTVHPAGDWAEEDGDVLWWHFPVCEPPIVGSHARMGTRDKYGEPTGCRRLQEEGWLTHWTPIPVVWDGDGTPLYPAAKPKCSRCGLEGIEGDGHVCVRIEV